MKSIIVTWLILTARGPKLTANCDKLTTDVIHSRSVSNHSPVLKQVEVMKTKRKGTWSSSTARKGLIFCSMVYGADYVATKMIQEEISPEVLNAFRHLIGSLIFLPYVVRFRGSLQLVWDAVEIGLLGTVGSLTQVISLEIFPASRVAFFSGFTLIMVPLFDALQSFLGSLRKERGRINTVKQHTLSDVGLKHRDASDSLVAWRPSGVFSPGQSQRKTPTFVRRLLSSSLVPVLLALAGGVVMETGSDSTADSPLVPDKTAFGLFLLIVSPATFALAMVRAERCATQYSDSLEVVSGVVLLTIFLGSISFSFFSSTGTISSPHSALSRLANSTLLWDLLCSGAGGHWLLLLLAVVTGLLSMGWTTLLEQRAVEVVSATEASVILALEPLFGAIFSLAFLAEERALFNRNIVIGGGLVLMATLWAPLVEMSARGSGRDVEGRIMGGGD